MPDSSKSVLRLGMVTVEPHGKPWAEVLRLRDDVTMSHAWDYDRARVEAYARHYGIGNVVDKVEAMLGQVDAVLIGGGRRPPVDDGIWGEERDDHLTLARPFLEAGLPVLIDKPFADSMEDAIEMVRLARQHHAPLMSCSAMRYASEIEALRQVVQDGGLGKISGAVCVIGTGVVVLKWYLIHMLEALYVAFGPGIESVFTYASHAPTTVTAREVPAAYGSVFRWRDGRVATILLASDETDAAIGTEQTQRSKRILWPTETVLPPYLPLHYNIRIYGDMNWAEARPVGKGCYGYKLDAFLRMVRTGEEAIPLEHTLELTQAIILAEKSAQTGQPQDLRPIEDIMAQIEQAAPVV